MSLITITIDYDGTPTIDVKGVAGGSCSALTKPLEEAFGVAISDEHTAEYNERPVEARAVQTERLRA